MKQTNMLTRIFSLLLGVVTAFFMGSVPKDGDIRTNAVIPNETKVEKEPENNTNPGNKKI